jgi:hypothetical protein
VKYNDKHWIVTKSLQDFELLNEELATENPKCKVPEWMPIDEESIIGKEEQIQKHLEGYLRVK